MDGGKNQQLINYSEGIVGKLYYDDRGNPSIGVGMNLNTETLPEDLAIEWSTRKRVKIQNDLMERLDFFELLDDVRQAVLVDMSYNMGVNGLMAFTKTLDLIRRKEYQEAANNLKTTPYYHQVGLRSERNCKMLITGLWPDFILQGK